LDIAQRFLQKCGFEIGLIKLIPKIFKIDISKVNIWKLRILFIRLENYPKQLLRVKIFENLFFKIFISG
jgi:hypothetical protein